MSKVSFVFALFLGSLCTDTVAVGTGIFETLHGAAVEIASSRLHTITDPSKYEGVKYCLNSPNIVELMPRNLSDDDIYWLALVFPEVARTLPITILVVALRQAAKLISEGIPVTMDVVAYASNPNIMSQIDQGDTYWLATLPGVMEVLPTDSKTKVLNDVAIRSSQGQQDFPNINVALYASDPTVVSPISQENTYWLATLPNVMNALPKASKTKALNVLASRLRQGEQCPPNINVASCAGDQEVMNPLTPEDTYWLATVPNVMNALTTTSKTRALNQVALRLKDGLSYSSNINVASYANNQAIMNPIDTENTYWLATVPDVMNLLSAGSKIKVLNQVALRLKNNQQYSSNINVASYASQSGLMNDIEQENTYWLATISGVSTVLPTASKIKTLKEVAARIKRGERYSENIDVIAYVSSAEIWNSLEPSEKAQILTIDGVLDVIPVEDAIKVCTDETLALFRYSWEDEKSVEGVLSRVNRDAPLMSDRLIDLAYDAAYNGIFKTFSKDTIGASFLVKRLSECSLDEALQIIAQANFEAGKIRDAAAADIANTSIKNTIIGASSSESKRRSDAWKVNIGGTIEASNFEITVANITRHVDCITDERANEFNSRAFRDNITPFIIDALAGDVANISKNVENRCFDFFTRNWYISERNCRDIAQAIGEATYIAATTNGNPIKQYREDFQNYIGAWKNGVQSDIRATIEAYNYDPNNVTVRIAYYSRYISLSSPDAYLIVNKLTDGKNDIAQAIVEAILTHTDISEAAQTACLSVLTDLPQADIEKVANAFKEMVTQAISETGNVIKNAQTSAVEIIRSFMSVEIPTEVINVKIADLDQNVIIPADDEVDITAIFTNDTFKSAISGAIVDAIIGNKDIGQAANDECFKRLRDKTVRQFHIGTAYNIAAVIGELVNAAKDISGNVIRNAVETAGDVSINNIHRLYFMGAMYAVMNKWGIPQTNANAEAASSKYPLITVINNSTRVAPWSYGEGGVTDPQRRSAALNLLRIAQTLK